MSVATSAGYDNLPNDKWNPSIFSQKVLKFFRRASVAEAITNTDYSGEIENFGDTVKIIKEPTVSVSSYTRGAVVNTQDLEDTEITLTVDQGNYFAFKVDDIEEAHSHVNFQELASNRAAYRLSDQFDQDVLGYLSGWKQTSIHGTPDTANSTVNGAKAVSTAGSDELLSSMKLDASDFTDGSGTAGSASNSIIVAPRTGGATDATPAAGSTYPLTIIARMARKLDQQNVDTNGRWLVLDPVFIELLKDEDSRLFQADWNGSGLQNGLVLNNLHGFKVYQSNNLPAKGTGPATAAASNTSNYGIIVAGHGSSVATAEQINKTETYRDPDSFADIVRGMHLYGRKILRPEAIATAIYNIA